MNTTNNRNYLFVHLYHPELLTTIYHYASNSKRKDQIQLQKRKMNPHSNRNFSRKMQTYFFP